ncbi:MAG: bis(5'-nucleosyl)-tetraphosphatase (symmetrical) YqeK [Oscillospiraceae bacterium]|nr:bis(5'-nucleosyl)-tetraphosphatase (symmetrical) YqeK [Oscillospiraceae bacterium]
MCPEHVEIREKLKKKLKPSRYEHTLGVCYTAVALAMRWGADLEKAELAGLLHDCAKRWSNEEIIYQCEKRDIPLTEGERSAPAVIHAKLGAWMAENKYGVNDPEVLSAIAVHTTGKPGMSLLDKIIYVSDFIEPGRKQLENLDEFRKLAFTDLEEAFFRICENILQYLERTGSVIDPASRDTYEYYLKNRRKVSSLESQFKGNDAIIKEHGEPDSETGNQCPQRRPAAKRSKGAGRGRWQKKTQGRRNS